MSKGRYIANFIPPSKETVAKIEKLKWNDKRKDKVIRKTAEESIDRDRLGVINI